MEQVNGTLMLHRRLAREYDPPARHLRLARLLALGRKHGPPPYHTVSGLA
ncbi:hypothetical protein [Streptomyces sp. NPDC051577]